MAIDVQSEAVKIANRISKPYPYSSEPVRNWHKVLTDDIETLVTRAVADAKLKQMEADCLAACRMCREPERWLATDSIGCHKARTYNEVITCSASPIRTAFAAKEPRDIVKEHVEAAATLNAVGKEKTLEQLIKAAVELATWVASNLPGGRYILVREMCDKILDAARELGLDGDA